ncbi:MAG: hypothetical protein ABFQ65_00415 [Nanoarchaeota archaeon]
MVKKKDKSKKKISTKGKKIPKTKKETVCEIFEVEKEGKEKIVRTCGQEEVKFATKDQIAHQNKLLRNILLTIGFFVGGFILILMIFYSMSHFELEGVKYNIIKEKDVTFYHTSFPSKYYNPGVLTKYDLYLRTDPRELKNIAFEGNLNLLEMGVVAIAEGDNFNCEGDGNIANVNFNNIIKAMGTTVTTDPEYSFCDEQGRYNYFEWKSGDETKIVQTSPICYDFVIKDCEVLEVTERFLIETLVNLNY